MEFSSVGFVLLKAPSFDFYRLVKDLNDIDLAVSNEDITDGEYQSLIFLDSDVRVVVAMMPAPVPDDEAVINAQNNYFWKEAVAVTKTHQAHLIVSVLGEGDGIKKGALLAFIAAKCLTQETAIGFNFAGTVFEPKQYIETANQHLEDGSYPTDLLVYIGVYQDEKGYYGYTFGLENFDKRELEILASQQDMWEIYQMLYNIATYVITNDITFNEGETLGYSETQKLALTINKGVALPEQETIKIGF